MTHYKNESYLSRLLEIPELTERQKQRFLSRINKEINPPCWIWISNLNQDGYGIININNQSYYSHRVSYSLYYPYENINNLLILHECDNPPCCNPYHLFTGTHNDNMKDSSEKKRKYAPILNKNNMHESMVIEIRYKFNELHYSKTQLAKEYGTCIKTIYNIIKHRTWRNI